MYKAATESYTMHIKAADMNVGNNFEVQILHNLQVVKGDCLKYVFMMSYIFFTGTQYED